MNKISLRFGLWVFLCSWKNNLDMSEGEKMASSLHQVSGPNFNNVPLH